METQWQVWDGGKASKAFTGKELRMLLKNGQVKKETLVSRAGSEEWMPVSQIDWQLPEVATQSATATNNPPKDAIQRVAQCLIHSALAFGALSVVSGIICGVAFGEMGFTLGLSGPLSVAVFLGVLGYNLK